MENIDSFDRCILSLMQRNSRQTGQQLAEVVGLSAAACLRRLDRLRRIGAIEREVAVLSKTALGEPLTQIIVLLSVTRHNAKRVDELTRRLRRLDEVQRIFSVTGQDDLVVILACSSMGAFSEFAEKNFHQPPVEGYQSMVVLKEIA